MGHEFGHFITAKRAGLLVTDFFVGFGPIVWSTQRGETRYGVRALLLGGYVKVPGMTWGVPVDPAIEPRTYREASYPKKVLFASAGSIMHGIMALVLAWAALTFIGVPSRESRGRALASRRGRGTRRTWRSSRDLKVGDQIVAVDGTKITSVDQLTDIVHHSAGKRLTLLVERQRTREDAARDARQRKDHQGRRHSTRQRRLHRHRCWRPHGARVAVRRDAELLPSSRLDHRRGGARHLPRVLTRASSRASSTRWRRPKRRPT